MKIHMKVALSASILLLSNAIGTKAQNLLNLSYWNIGTGTTGPFIQNGENSENIREWGEGPNGKRVVLWKAIPDGASNADGGYNSEPISITHTNMYRFSIWIKKTNSHSGATYLGCSNVTDLNGAPNDNPYFWYGALPELNKWYLLVGYIHGSGDPSTVNYGGIYDGVTGAKVVGTTDFRFTNTSSTTTSRSYLYYDPNVNDRQYFYAPRVDLVNGNEPSISSLLSIEPSTSSQGYFAGKVGIKTTTPGNYDLAVNGKIRAQEIKVENANWPDFVFANSYVLPTLKETEAHIKEKGHLPGIPSAADVKANGVDLGEMNAKLLQKIEELTLYLIEKDKQIEIQNKRLETINNSNANYEARLKSIEEKPNSKP